MLNCNSNYPDMVNQFERIEIRAATISDLLTLQAISKTTFLETFRSTNSNEDMMLYLTDELSLNKLTDELHNADSLFYFATLYERTIGYLKLNKGQAQTEIKDNRSLEIERIYVLKEHHGQKVGQLLYSKAIEVAQQLGVSYVWLGVWEKNPRAIGFYQKNGFFEFDKHLFRLGNDEQTDIMMRKDL